MHLFKLAEWESNGKWHCGDIEDLANDSNVWWLPARMLGMSPAEYLKWVIETFKPDDVYYSKDVSFVGWSWTKQSNMRIYKNKLNALARQKNFII